MPTMTMLKAATKIKQLHIFSNKTAFFSKSDFGVKKFRVKRGHLTKLSPLLYSILMYCIFVHFKNVKCQVYSALSRIINGH